MNSIPMYIRDNWEVDGRLLGKSVINHLKYENRKKQKLHPLYARKSKIAFHDKNLPSTKLMNSKTELYSQCTCKARFLGLSTVGNAGADEATS